MAARLALFDLDNTLLRGDSDHAWGEFLIRRGLVDEAAHRAGNDGHYADYLAGRLDMQAYVPFALGPVVGMAAGERRQLQAAFLRECVAPMILPAGRELVRGHQQAGDCCVIVTATNSFVTGPVAGEFFGIKHLLATELEEADDGRLTGDIRGVPCYHQGKVVRVEEWLGAQAMPYRLDEAVFYSDSITDLPLLERVGEAVAVDPDAALKREAERRGWRVINLR